MRRVTPPPASVPRDRTGLALICILLLSVGLFTPTLINGFTYDDPHYARTTTPAGETNPMVAELRPFSEYWQKPMNWGVPGNCRGFRPITVYSYALVNALAADPQALGHDKGDDRAWAQHLLNLLLHGLATLGVFLLAHRQGAKLPALLAAGVFGIHALHSDPVASIVGRAEILAFLGGCAATLVYGRALQLQGPRRVPTLALTALLLLLGLGSKESALAWIVFIPVYYTAVGVTLRQQAGAGCWALLLPTLAYLFLRQQMLVTHVEPQGPFWVEHDANPLYYMPDTQRVANAIYILAYGLGKTLLPTNLSSNYGDGPFQMVEGPLNFRTLSALAVLTLLLAGAFRVRRKHPLFFLAAAAFFGFSFITSNIPFPIETIFGERLFYTPVLGLSLLVAGLVPHIPRPGRNWAIAALVLWALWNAQLSLSRSRAWFDNMNLFRADLQSQPDSVGLHIDIGNLHLWNFDQQSGEAAFRRALEINPQSPRALRHCAESAPYDEACALLQRALASPHLVAATEGRRIHWTLGNLHQQAGKPEDAQRSIRRALACKPRDPSIRMHLLREAARSGDWQEFGTLLEDGLRLLPEHPGLLMFRAYRLQEQQEYEAAAQLFARVLPELGDGPQILEAWSRHARGLIHLGHLAKAEAIARRLLLQPNLQPPMQKACAEILSSAAAAKPQR